jgi:integrase
MIGTVSAQPFAPVPLDQFRDEVLADFARRPQSVQQGMKNLFRVLAQIPGVASSLDLERDDLPEQVMRTGGYTHPNTRALVLWYYYHACRIGQERGRLGGCPVSPEAMRAESKAGREAVANDPNRRIPTWAVVERLWHQLVAAVLEGKIDGRILVAVALILYAGLSHGELLRLRWEDIDTEGGFIRVPSRKGRTVGTRPSHIPLAVALVPILAWWRPLTSSEYVVPARRGGAWTSDSQRHSFGAALRIAGRLAGIEHLTVRELERFRRLNVVPSLPAPDVAPKGWTAPAAPTFASKPKPTRPTAASAPRPRRLRALPAPAPRPFLILGASHEEAPIVLGHRLAKLTKKQWDVVKALFDAGPEGLSEEALTAVTGYGGCRKTLETVVLSHQHWGTIFREGTRGRGGKHTRFAPPGDGWTW